MKKTMPNLLKDAKNVLADYPKMREYAIQEKMLQHLVCSYHDHKDPAAVAVKVKSLNQFYSTGITAVKALVAHVQKLGKEIDKAFTQKSAVPGLVEKIANLKLASGYRRNYSFATKYCALHEPKKYPIYDDIVAEVLSTLFMKGLLQINGINYSRIPGKGKMSKGDFKDIMNKDYSFYINVYDAFMDQAGLTSLTYRQVDNYLWGAYKIGNRKYRINGLAPIKKKVVTVNIK